MKNCITLNFRFFATALFIVLLGHASSAQVASVNIYGNDSLMWSNHIRTYDRGYLISNMNGFDSSFCFIKVDSLLNTSWTLSVPMMGNPGTGSGALRMVEFKDGSVVVLVQGTTIVMKISAAGTLVWRREYTNVNLNVSWYSNTLLDIAVTDSNTLVVCGYAFYNTALGGTRHGWIQTMDSSGTILWSRDYLSSSNTYFSLVTATPGGGFTAVGEDFQNRLFLIHLSDSGHTYWEKLYEEPEFAGMNYEDLEVTSDTSYLLLGNHIRFLIPNNEYRGVLVKFDSNGDYNWAKMYGDTNLLRLYDVIDVPDGYVIGGVVSVQPGCGANGLLMCANKVNGQVIWQNVIGDPTNPLLYSVCLGSVEFESSGYLAFGYTNLLSPNSIAGHNAAIFSTNLTGIVSCYSIFHPLYEFGVAPLTAAIPVNNTYQHSIYDFASPNTSKTFTCNTNFGCVVGVSDLELTNEGFVYPNPAHDVIHFLFERPSSNRIIVIYDLLGNELMRQSCSNQQIGINISTFSSGFYLWMAEENAATVQSGRFVVE